MDRLQAPRAARGGALVLLLLFAAARLSVLCAAMPDGPEEPWVNWYQELPYDAEAERLGRELAAASAGKADAARRIHDWVCGNIAYDWDAFAAGTYGALSPGDVLRAGRSVCEGVANLTQALFQSAEIPCVKVWGAAIGKDGTWEVAGVDPGRINHTWNEFYLDGEWRPLDCTMDIHSEYRDGRFSWAEGGGEYFAPDPETFAQTHRALYRKAERPENIPDAWARAELSAAATAGTVPLSCFTAYAAPASGEMLCRMLGMDGGDGAPLTRAEAAVLAASRLETRRYATPFTDLGACETDVCAAVETLYACGVMRGTGATAFSPDAILTRQEAILIAARLYGRAG